MQVLHVLRSEPDPEAKNLIQEISEDNPKTYPLYTKEVDWDDFVEQIFNHDKVICWW